MGHRTNVMLSISFGQTLIALEVLSCIDMDKRRGSLTYDIEGRTADWQDKGASSYRSLLSYSSIILLFLPMFLLAHPWFWNCKWQKCTFNLLFIELFTSESLHNGRTSGSQAKMPRQRKASIILMQPKVFVLDLLRTAVRSSWFLCSNQY